MKAKAMSDQEWELTNLKSRCNNLERKLEQQRRRTDKIREAVAAYLAGEISRKRLERVFNDTDYSYAVAE